MQLTDPVKSAGGTSVGFDMAMQCEKLQKSKNKAIVRMPVDENVLFICIICCDPAQNPWSIF
jgi:hypothetical protein